MPAVVRPHAPLDAATPDAWDAWRTPVTDITGALAGFREALGDAHVTVNAEALARYGRSTGPEDRAPIAVVYPSTTAEVQAVVRVAARCRVPLHAISRGKNWGY